MPIDKVKCHDEKHACLYFTLTHQNITHAELHFARLLPTITKEAHNHGQCCCSQNINIGFMTDSGMED